MAVSAPARGSDVALDPGALEQVVVLDVPARRLEVGVSLPIRLPVGVVEQEELEFGCCLDREAHRVGALELHLQHRARRDGDGFVGVHVDDVAQHDRRRIGPARTGERRHVGHEMEVAVAQFPARVVVAVDGFHLHVDGQQVVAGVGAVAERLVEEEPRVETLAQQTSVVVGEGDQHGVDLAGGDQGVEVVRVSRCRDSSRRREPLGSDMLGR